ncbi:MAG: hypothetical protein LC104_12380, partial [Bacteroidales bacterium]|nr:hypothetical protein [Bacteroidales bacterium]
LYTSMPIGSSSNMEILAYRIAKYDEKNGVFRVTASEIEASATFALDKSRISQLNDCTEIRFKPKVPGVYRVYVASRPIEAKTGKMAASTQPLLLIVRPESSK